MLPKCNGRVFSAKATNDTNSLFLIGYWGCGTLKMRAKTKKKKREQAEQKTKR
jgi:hypothetical protein